MGTIFSAIGGAINAVVSAIASIIMIIVSAIVTVLVTIVDIIFDIICCNCFGGRQRRCQSGSDGGTNNTSTISLGTTNRTIQVGPRTNITASILPTGVNSTTPSFGIFSSSFHTADVRTSSVVITHPTHPVDELNTSKTAAILSPHSSPTTHSTISPSSSQQTSEPPLSTTTSTQTSTSPAQLPSPLTTSPSHPEPDRTHEGSPHSDAAIISASVGAPLGVFVMLLLVLVLRKCRKRPTTIHGQTAANTSDLSAQPEVPQSARSLLEASSETATMNSTSKRSSAARMSSRPIVHITFPPSLTTLVDAPRSPPLEPNRRPPSPLPGSPHESADSEGDDFPDGDTSPRRDGKHAPKWSRYRKSQSEGAPRTDVSELHRDTDAGSLPYPLREEQVFAWRAGLPPAYEDLPPRRLAPNRLQGEQDDIAEATLPAGSSR
ncbi:hypothetical protein ACG7TL_000664 [Trametes sanguinea]